MKAYNFDRALRWQEAIIRHHREAAARLKLARELTFMAGAAARAGGVDIDIGDQQAAAACRMAFDDGGAGVIIMCARAMGAARRRASRRRVKFPPARRIASAWPCAGALKLASPAVAARMASSAHRGVARGSVAREIEAVVSIFDACHRPK